MHRKPAWFEKRWFAALPESKSATYPAVVRVLEDGTSEFVGDSAAVVDAARRKLKPVATDEDGFKIYLEEAQIAWLRVPYLKKLAEWGGPCPRRQDLDPSGIIVGRMPTGRKVSVSHGWDATFHISPSGEKLNALKQRRAGSREGLLRAREGAPWGSRAKVRYQTVGALVADVVFSRFLVPDRRYSDSAGGIFWTANRFTKTRTFQNFSKRAT